MSSIIRLKNSIIFYSDSLGLPSRKLNEITTQAMGKLVMELISDRVLAESEALLASTGLPIKSISYELGFIDQSHFATYFRKHKAINPKGFRKAMQQVMGQKASNFKRRPAIK